ncbi:hypothetical protein [uncultured Nocardioides sp.]|uniref:hypothetical protein n=1 Tax=uncultured Nocardioides sp. TaxID=198441 RepID=UPI0026143891|nr:hypothetical protein [uncultured Nocardioides sp.]
MTTTRAELLAAGDITGLLARNRAEFGGARMMARGYYALGDRQLKTADGRDFNELFAELTEVMSLANDQQQRFTDVFTYPVTSPVTSVLQTVGGGADVFEVATEYGIPEASRLTHETLDLGATFQWYDARLGWTWRYLTDASDAEITAATVQVINADRENVFTDIMRTVFSPTTRKVTDPNTKNVYDVFAFANGDGWTPPAYNGNTFPGSHTHFRTSGEAQVVSSDLDVIIDDFKSHGYSAENGTQVVIFVNAFEGNRVSRFRVADGDRADFIPASGARFYAEGQLVGDQPAATFAGFPVLGGYGDAILNESDRIPAGYVVGLASGGRLVNSNPLMLREHSRIKGLTVIEGSRSDYPLIDSYFTHGFGTGVRHRLAGFVLQISTNATYTPPSLYVAS